MSILLCVTCVSMYHTNIHGNKHHAQRACRDLLHSSILTFHDANGMNDMMHSIEGRCTA